MEILFELLEPLFSVDAVFLVVLIELTVSDQIIGVVLPEKSVRPWLMVSVDSVTATSTVFTPLFSVPTVTSIRESESFALSADTLFTETPPTVRVPAETSLAENVVFE